MTEINQNNHSKQHPPRRGRGGAGGRNRGARKNYASEGDALTEMPRPAGLASKNAAGSHPQPTPPKKYIEKHHDAMSESRPFPKGRPKNTTSTHVDVCVTPNNSDRRQRTPPLTDPIHPRLVSSAAAFSLSRSFHSPAPNTLPRPVFTKAAKSETFAHDREGASVRARSESFNAQHTKGPSSMASDSEASPSQHTEVRVRQETRELLLEQEVDYECEIRRANSANAAVPFSAPSRTQHGPFINDAAIPFVLARRPAQHGMSDHNGNLASVTQSNGQANAFERPVHQSFPSVQHSQPNMPHMPAQSSQAHSAQPNSHHFAPQEAQGQPPQPHRQQFLPQTVQAHSIRPPVQQYAQNEQMSAAQNQPRYFSTPHAQGQLALNQPLYSYLQRDPHCEPGVTSRPETVAEENASDQLKKLLWAGSGSQNSKAPASAPDRFIHSTEPPQSVPFLGVAPDPLIAGVSNSGAQDPRKSLAEDALRKVLGLNLPLSMSSGLDGNHSPQSRYSGHA